MKTKHITKNIIIIFLVTIINIILIYNNITNVSYKKEKEIKSIPNYIEVTEDNPIVDDALYINSMIDQINKSLNSTVSGKGELIVKHSIETGVDPYIATAILLQETGCSWECSYLVNYCNNVGGQKGSGCGSYSAFNTLDEGIIAFIDNLSVNYFSQGLNTPELINTKYASSTEWSYKVNKYIEIIKAR